MQRSVISFTLNPNADFIHKATSAFLASVPSPGFSVFIQSILQTECLKFAIHVANKIIECYRISFDDPEARPIGIADLLTSALVVTFLDGEKCVYSTGSPFYIDSFARVRNRHANKNYSTMADEMQTLLLKPSPPFLFLAMFSLKTAHLYGQYRECVVWAGVIISNVIDNILLSNLPRDSSEYRKLKTNGSDVTGKQRRNVYFRKATGYSLSEYLENIRSQFLNATSVDQYWNNLSANVEKALNNRNLLLHRKKAISSREADEAFYTCMNFVFAIELKVPYSLYSKDYSVKLGRAIL